MATQKGIFKLSGKVGDLIFSKRGGKYQARQKSDKPVNQTEATKLSSADFGQASKAGARLRRSFAEIIQKYGDTTIVTRFTKRMMAVFNTCELDTGSKSLVESNITLLLGFQFNAAMRLDHFVPELPQVNVHKSTLTINYTKSASKRLYKHIPKAEKVVLQLWVAVVDLDHGNDEVIQVQDLSIQLDHDSFNGAKLQLPIDFIGEQILLVGLGVHYLSATGMIGDWTKRAAAIISAKRLNDGEEVQYEAQKKVAMHEQSAQSGPAWELG